ncbi:MAG: dienelactone hydrolase family protein [Chloroflexi bacterium]|nr:dienelactone hydrolase family protein [Chloroflexota bacterium]
MPQQQLNFDSNGLSLQGILEFPESDDKVPGVVICHPHPRHGGDMVNDVVVGLSQSLNAIGIATLRFNFRGVGASEGAHDNGNGEVDDALSALDALELDDAVDASRIGIAGYSFGASIALQAALDSIQVKAVFSVACPIGPFRALSSLELLQPKMLVLGDHDHDFPVGEFRFLTKRFSQPKDVEVISNADHFFRGIEAEVGKMASIFFNDSLGGNSVQA